MTVKTNPRILILTADAGFGHRRAAQAVKAALQEKLGTDGEAIITNPFQDPGLPDLLRQLETGYDDVVTDDPTLYQLAYAATDAPMVAKLLQDAATTALIRTMKKMITSQKPDAIVTTYPAFTQAAIRATAELKAGIPVSVVVTDLVGVHSMWFHERAALTFVPTGRVYRQALDQGLAKSKVALTGLPIHPQYYREKRDRRAIRQALGWDLDMVTALVVGSPRSTQTAQIARLLDRSGLDLQVVALGGGAQQTADELAATDWKGTVHLYGLVENMPELMHAADFVVCKAGGLIITEALGCGLPLVLYEALPGQEVGNVKYVVEAGAGVWSPGPIGVLATAYAWFARGKREFERCRAAARKVGKPGAAYDVAERVLKQLH